MTKQHILIVEDEEKIANLISKYLTLEGFSFTHVADGKNVIPQFNQCQADLIILDVMLPNIDGIELCKSLREIADTPIIMLTARVDEIDRLIGFDVGADDYVCKPFKPKELMARIKAILKRVNREQRKNTTVIKKGTISLDTNSHKVFVKSQEVTLTLNEFNLLKIFLEHPDRVFSRQELLKITQGKYFESYERTIDSHIKNLRKKLTKADPNTQHIKSIYGVGYQYIPEKAL
ncbi:MAG: response regulator transcription factor [Colwellia sp.]|nr:response regulator transcription factor [Colwellia sp.]